MKRLAYANQCPACLQSFRYRITRKFWMRIIPGSRHYFCDLCWHTSVSLFRKTSFRLNRLPTRKVKEIVDDHSWDNIDRVIPKARIYFNDIAGDAIFCYENQHINRLKALRYLKFILTGKGESGSLDFPFFIFNPPIFRISNLHRVSWYDVVNVSK